MKFIGLTFVLMLSSFFFLGQASAADGDWLLCDTCTTPAQFEARATSYTGTFSGEFGYFIANSISGEIRYIRLTSRSSGTIPTAVPMPSLNNVSSAGGQDVQAVPSGQMIYQILLDNRQSAETEVQFMDIVEAAISSGNIVDHGQPEQLPDNPGFESFGGRNQNSLRDYLWNNYGQHIYGVRTNSIIAQYLLKALNMLQAKYAKPSKCFIFNNGDIACFNVPETATAQAAYLPTTAKNQNNVPLDGTSGGGGYNVRPGTGGSNYGPIGYASTGSLWLFCTLVNGKVTSCYVQWMAD